MPYGLTTDDETQTPIASPIADSSTTGSAVRGLQLNPAFGPAPGAPAPGGSLQLNPAFGPPQAPAAPKQPEQGDFMRGVSTSIDQTKQAYYGVKAFVGDALGSTEMRDNAIRSYQDIEDKVGQRAKPTDSFSEAMQMKGGVGDLIDFAQYGAGYVAAQAGEALLSGGLGSFVAKTMAKGALKQGLEKALTSTIEKKVAAGMTEEAAVRSAFGNLGAGAALGGFNLTQELGQIYPDALKEAADKGEDPNLLRVFGSSVLAAAVETAADKFNWNKAGKALKGGEQGGKSFLRNVATEAFAGGLREGGTELLQTGIERWGANQDLSSPEAIKDYIDSAALGVLGGGMFGSLAGAAKKRGPVEATPEAQTTETPLDPNTVQGYVPANPIQVDETLREKYAPDLKERGIDPNSVEGNDAIQRLEAIERATGVIRAKDAETERSAREQEVNAAFGQTATSGVGVGVGGAESMIKRESIRPNEEERTVEPVGAAPETVTLPEASWMDSQEAKTTKAIAPEDVVARQQDWEAPEAFDHKSRSGEPATVANRFVSEAQALGFAKKYAVNTAETQFQVREAQKSQAEGGGKYYFIEERPLKSPNDELVVGLGTREQLAPKEPNPAVPAVPVPNNQGGPTRVEQIDRGASEQPGPGQEGAGNPVSAAVDEASTTEAPAQASNTEAAAEPAPVEHEDALGHPISQDAVDEIQKSQKAIAKKSGNASYTLEPAPAPDNEAFKAAADVAHRFFGKQVVPVQQNNGRVFNGYYTSRTPGHIYVDVNSERPAMAVIGHELTHSLAKDDPEGYQALRKAVKGYLNPGAFDSHRSALNEKYKAQGLPDLSKNKAHEEMIGDVVGDFFTDPKFWDHFADSNQGIFQRVAKKVSDFLNHLHSVLTGHFAPFGTKQYLAEVEKARETVADAMAKYAASRPQAEPSETGAMDIAGTKIKGEKTPTISKLLRSLTPEEKRKITDKTAEKIVEQMSNLPSAKEMAAIAFAGKAKRGWYAQSAQAISSVFQGDAPRFAALLAAMSPQTSVETNLTNALNTWKNWVAAGRPTDREAILDVMGNSVQGNKGRDSVLDAWVNNSVRALTTEDPGQLIISGPKVNSFFRNLVGVVEEVTNDAWMANYALVDQKIFGGSLNALGTDPGKGAGYLAMSARVREAAAQLTKLTGETWTPAEVQETVWSWAKTVYEMADSATEDRTAQQLVKDRAVTDELINATPDFGTLFYNPEYASILEEAGYGPQLESLRSAVGGNAERLAQEPAPGEQAAPFAQQDQLRHELRAAGRLDQLRDQRRSGADEGAAAPAKGNGTSVQGRAGANAAQSEAGSQPVQNRRAVRGSDGALASAGDEAAGNGRADRSEQPADSVLNDEEGSFSVANITRPGWDEATVKALNDPFNPAPQAPIKERLQGLQKNWAKRVTSALVDPFVALKDIDDKLYMRARLTNGTDGGLEAMLRFGQVYDHDGALDVRKGTKGLIDALKPLGTEVEDFFRWVALNRAAQLKKEDREHFFTDQSIALRHKLTEGKMENGESRVQVYGRALTDMNALNRSVLDLARKSGLIDQAGYDRFSKDMYYVPFYRIAEERDGDVSAYADAAGLSGQTFGKRLKGGTDRVGALLPNLLKNWGGLLAAAQKNSVARDTMSSANELGFAHEVPSGTAGAAKVMVDGRTKSYAIDDPLLASAVMSINQAALNHPILKTLNAFKKWLTGSVTFDPAFKIRNLIRDSVQSMALADLPFNPIANVANGIRGLRGDASASVLAGGGLFGHQMDEGDLEHRIKLLAEKGINEKTIIRHPTDVVRYLKEGYDKVGMNLENANRVALYNALIAQGKSHLEASYQARDLMDFSLQGHAGAVRMLSMVLPFFNARLQGLYKIGRDGVVPTMLTLMGKANESQRKQAARFSAVAGAVTLASLYLYMLYKDDDDFKRREQWDRDNFWWFKAGDTAYRIPKPFELGAIATIAERGLEQIVDRDATGRDFAKSMTSMLGNTFAFDPVPQAFRPALNLIANQDSFTGRPIETMGMEQLSKTERYNQGTSETAKVLSRVNAAVAGALGPAGEGMVLSPAQIDYLARGYFSWVGSTIMQSTGALMKWNSDVASPASRLEDYPLVGGFAKSLPQDQSKYVSDFYQSATQIDQLWQDIKFNQKMGQMDKARELMRENPEAVQLHGIYNRASREISKLNQQMRSVEASPSMTSDQKREALDTLSQRKATIAQRVEVMKREQRSR